ncbi:MAG: 3-phosphoshikimate 1-carboxyvinyltransferase [bacterium]
MTRSTPSDERIRDPADDLLLEPVRGLRGSVSVPGDKSISHRALIFGALTEGTTRIENLSPGDDVQSTARCLTALGVPVRREEDRTLVEGAGARSLSEPGNVLDAGNSGTTIRLLAGVLSGQPFFSVLTGDESLRKRPMSRVVTPLLAMGASIWARGGGRYAPLAIRGASLSPIRYAAPVPSAQVKTAILLAALPLKGEVSVTEPTRSRDHTERMLRYLGADLAVEGTTVRLRGTGGQPLAARAFPVPGDPSSAAFLVVAALVTPDSDLHIRGVCANPTRTGYLGILQRMGARLEWEHVREEAGEPVGDLRVHTSRLQATEIRPEEIPAAIDEVPVLCIAAALADGVTRITGAAELRVKESDRIAAMAENLEAMGVPVQQQPDGLEIRGRARIPVFHGSSWGDHRVALSLMVAAMAAEGPCRVSGASCVSVSFPDFLARLTPLIEAR